MKLGTMVVENFMSIQHAELNFSNKGLVLVQGINDDSDAFESNGAGKSTLISEAPTWALFGETIRGQKGDKVVNKHIGKNTRVYLEVIDDNGDVYEIVRYRKHKEFKNHTTVYRNGENISAKSDKDTDQLIIDLLEMDYLTFTNSIMFGQGVTKMFASSTDKEQKAILEKMLQIDIYKACQERAKEYVKQYEGQIKDLENEQSVLIKQKENYEQTIEDLQRKEAELGEKCKERIEQLSAEINRCTEQKSKLLDDIEELLGDKTSYEALLKKVDAKIDNLYADVQKARDELSGEERSLKRERDKIAKEITKKEKEYNDLLSGKNVPKTCPSCGQDLPLEDTTHLQNHLKDSIENLKEELSEVHHKWVQTFNKLEDTEEELKGKEVLEKQRRDLEGVLRDIKADIKVANNKRDNLSKVIDDALVQIVGQKELANTTYTELIEDNINKANEIKSSLLSIVDSIAELNEELSQYKFWADAYGNTGIKSVLLDSVVPFLNTRANKYLAEVADSSIEVKFNTQTELKNGEKRDKFQVEIINHNGDDDYKSNSGGEKRRIDIAVNMALQDLVMSRSNKRLDVVVYDEVYESLDEVGSHKVIGLLEQKAKEVGTVLVITHNDSLKQLFTQSMVVKKQEGKTKIYTE